MRDRRPFSFLATFLVSSPFAWLGLVVVAVFHGLYAWWFHPSALMQGAAVLVDLVSLGIGVTLALTSPGFRKFVNRTPLEEKKSELKKLLAGCTERFRELALQCMTLIGTVGREFSDQRYGSELADLVSNLVRLAGSNTELHHRWKAFGTPGQKAAMERHLEAQARSLETMQASLKELAGNLSLIDATSDQSAASTEGLRDINRGLEELMKEWSNESGHSS